MKCKTGRRGLRASTMEGAAEAAPAPGCSAPSGSLAASASTRRPPPLPVPQSLTDPRWPPLGFLRCLRMPEVTAPPPPGAQPIRAARGSRPAAVARGDLVLSRSEAAALWARTRRPGAVGCGRRAAGARCPRESRRVALGGGLAATAGVAFAVLVERLLWAEVEVAPAGPRCTESSRGSGYRAEAVGMIHGDSRLEDSVTLPASSPG